MRTRPAHLVDPHDAHLRVFAEDMGLAMPRTIGKRTVDLAHEKAQGGKPPLLVGTWADGTAGANLAGLMHGIGQVNNATDLGETPTDPLALENFGFASQLTSDTPSTTDTVNFSQIIALAFVAYTGVWKLDICAEASFTNSAGGINNLRIRETTTNTVIITGGPTTQTTRERYSLDQGYLDIIAPQTVAFAYEYKPSAAATATARAPWLMLFAARTS